MPQKERPAGMAAASEELAEIATLIYDGKANEALQVARDLARKVGRGTFVVFASGCIFAARMDEAMEKKLGRPTGK